MHNIRTIRDSINRYVLVTSKPMSLDAPPAERAMVSNRSFRDFRVTTLPAKCIGPETVRMPPELAEALQVQSGDSVRLAPLKEGGFWPIHSHREGNSFDEKSQNRIKKYRSHSSWD